MMLFRRIALHRSTIISPPCFSRTRTVSKLSWERQYYRSFRLLSSSSSSKHGGTSATTNSDEESDSDDDDDDDMLLFPPATAQSSSFSQTNPLIFGNTALYNPSGVEAWNNQDSFNSSILQDRSNDATRSLDLTHLYDPQLHLPSAPTNWNGYEPSTPVAEELIAQIAVTGRPVSTATFMDVALLHPEWGYYTRAKSRAMDDDDFDDTDDDLSKEKDTHILSGDFLTSPEITNVFGQTLGAWFWAITNTSDSEPYQLLECGPGTGQLMQDWLSVCCSSRTKSPPTAVHLVEQSPALREQQRLLLEASAPSLSSHQHLIRFVFPQDDEENESSSGTGIRVYWHATLSEYRQWSQQQQSTAAVRTLIVAHEFLDALPVYSFEAIAEDGTLRERLVDVALREDLEKDLRDEKQQQKSSDAVSSPNPPTATEAPSEVETPSTTAKETEHSTNEKKPGLKPRFRMVLAPEVTPPLKTLLNVDGGGRLIPSNDTDDDAPAIPVGSIVEVCPQAILFAQDVAAIVAETNGAALVIDYGNVGSRDSLRGYTRHAQVDFLSRPGQIDITADVDFGAVRHAVNSTNIGARAYGPLEQGQFLVSMGLGDLLIRIMEKNTTTDEMAEQLCEAYKRLVTPDEMGARYKVMAIVPTGEDETPPPPFEVMEMQQRPTHSSPGTSNDTRRKGE